MNAFSNSIFFTADLGLLRFYLQQAVENSSSKSLKELDFIESQKLVKEYIIPAVQQTVQDYSNVGNWKDEKDYVLLKIHGCFFLSWMTTTLENTCEMFVPVGIAFYLQVIKMCSFELFLLQCLCNVSEETVEVLIQSIAQSSKVCGEKEVKNLLLHLVEQCLLQLGSFEGWYGKISDAKLCHVLIQIVRNVEQQLSQVHILLKLADQLHRHLSQFKESSNRTCNLENGFTKKVNIIEFNEKIINLTREVEKLATLQKPCTVKLVEDNANESLLKQPVKATLCLVSCVKQIITVEWRSLFSWQSNDLGEEIIGFKHTNCGDVLLDVFTACKSLQSLTVDRTMYNELQAIIDLLYSYFEQHVTLKERVYIENTTNDARIESSNYGNEFGMINGTLNEKMQYALFQIDEKLFGDEMCFEWLLMTEDLYVDKRWLNCVMTHAKSFVSIKTVKMLLDILSVIQEFDMQEGVYSNIYTSLKKVFRELIPYLSLPEQSEVVLYNFKLICLHFDSYQHHSFFVPPGDQSGCSLIKEILTATLNKIVNRSGQAGFTKDVTDGIIQSCLIAPYLTLKELLSEAVKHNGFDSVICELLQIIPWLVTLVHNDDDSLIVQVLRELMSLLTSKKQEERILKLVEKLMQPYMHPDFEVKELALIPAAKIYQGLVIPLLTSENDDVTILVLNILMKSLSCSLNSIEQLPHWIINQQPLQLLFILLEMYEDCEQFWEDWVTASSENPRERSDVAFDEAWNEMNVILKIVEEYLVPLLKEDIYREPTRYYGNISWMQDHLYQQDWNTSMLIVPLLQNDVFKECKIKMPKPMMKLMCSHLNTVPFEDEGSARPFWTIYFKACALSNEVCGIYLSKLNKMRPRESEANVNDSEEIIRDLAQLLPFSPWKQWWRILNIALTLVKYGYLILPWEWKAELADLPDISKLDHQVINTSELLILMLLEIQNKHWVTSYVWSITIKNYVSTMKEISLEIDKEDRFQVGCHLLAHLAYIAFKIVPEGFQENVTIILLDIFNQCLTCVSTEDIDMSTHYLHGIVNMICSNELKLTMASKMKKMLSNNANK